MAERLSATLLARLRDQVATQMGLYFPPARQHDLARGIVAAASAFGFADSTSCAEWLLSAPLTRPQIEMLAGFLTIGETYFFREQATFRALRERLIPELIQTRRQSGRRLQIWSAGCCTGEEPYSIAILLSQLIPDWQAWSVTILGTDINPQYLRKAVEGVYGEWSFRGLAPEIKARYFRKTGNSHFEILPQIRERVTFAYMNLASGAPPTDFGAAGEMDVIFCRNVLMYFAPEQATQAARTLHRSLADDGWLIPGLSEASHALFSEFVPVRFPDAVLYQKGDAPPSAMAASRRAWLHFAAPEEPRPEARTSTTRTELGLPMTAAPDLEAWAAATVGTVEQADTSLPSLDPSRALYTQGQYVEAEALTHQWLRAHPGDVSGMELMARILANQGRLDDALAWCQQVVAADPLRLGGHYLFATIQQECGEVEEAAKSFKRVLYLDSEFAPAHFALGYLARGQPGADRHFANAVAILRRYRPDEVLPESDGLTAGRLLAMVEAIRS